MYSKRLETTDLVNVLGLEKRMHEGKVILITFLIESNSTDSSETQIRRAASVGIPSKKRSFVAK